MAEFMLEKAAAPPKTSGPQGRRSEALEPILNRIKADNLVGEWYKIARYDKRTSAGGTLEALNEKYGDSAAVAGWTFALSADVNAAEEKISDDTLVMALYTPENIMEGADTEHAKKAAAAREYRRERNMRANEKRKAAKKAGNVAASASDVPGENVAVEAAEEFVGEPAGEPAPGTEAPAKSRKK